ncbi:MAG: hypothetical protein NVS9B14_20030 [Candidatus Acidiferrum sp.]
MFFVETGSALFRVAFLAVASVLDGVEDLRAERIVGAGEFHHPGFLHLRIAKDAEAAKEFSACLAEVAPDEVWVDFFKDRCEGTATAKGDAEIVDGFFVRR